MEINLQIREATVEDSEGLRKCMQAAYAPYLGRMAGMRLPPIDVDYSSEIENYPVWLADSAGRIVGGLIMDFVGDRAWIANIAIDPACQGQGIGGRLIKFAEAKARQRQCAELHLATHVLLDENISLYRHLGWEETGRDDSRVYMKKSL
jgi:GNAT superfamily N-acetyltransferase